MITYWKPLLAVLAILALACESSISDFGNITHISNSTLEEDEVSLQIYCYYGGMDNLHPYIMSTIYPNTTRNLTGTKEGVYFLRATNLSMFGQEAMLIVRHNCVVDTLPLMPNCSNPYYTTMIPLDINQTHVTPAKFELFDQKPFSKAGCLPQDRTTVSNSNDTSSSSISDSPNKTSAQLYAETELAKIAATCLNFRHYELLAGDMVKSSAAAGWHSILLHGSAWTMGLVELRRALDFGPWRWRHFKRMWIPPSENEHESMEEYYERVETVLVYQTITLDSHYFHVKSFAIATAYLDEQFPALRRIFSRRFEEMRQENNGLIDKELIDRMTDESVEINGKIQKAFSEMDSYKPGCAY